MSRRDIIIIAVLANIGVLALLFMLAFRSDEDKVSDQTDVMLTIVEEPADKAQETHATPTEVELHKTEPTDEVDTVLEDITPLATPKMATDDDAIQLLEQDTPTPPTPSTSIESPKESTDKFVEVTVKSGDALEKIARANRTTVDAIMKANNMKSDRLKIGQVLKVPVGTKKATAAAPKPAAKVIAASDAEYYTLKSGDNPWKIAKQFHLKLDELLKLNNLDEDSARKLKAGDQVRVR